MNGPTPARPGPPRFAPRVAFLAARARERADSAPRPSASWDGTRRFARPPTHRPDPSRLAPCAICQKKPGPFRPGSGDCPLVVQTRRPPHASLEPKNDDCDWLVSGDQHPGARVWIVKWTRLVRERRNRQRRGHQLLRR